jgi:hypothetical protein
MLRIKSKVKKEKDGTQYTKVHVMGTHTCKKEMIAVIVDLIDVILERNDDLTFTKLTKEIKDMYNKNQKESDSK